MPLPKLKKGERGERKGEGERESHFELHRDDDFKTVTAGRKV